MHVNLAIVPLKEFMLSRGSRLTNSLARAKEIASKLNMIRISNSLSMQKLFQCGVNEPTVKGKTFFTIKYFFKITDTTYFKSNSNTQDTHSEYLVYMT
jgi:hypothetical protein